MKDIDKQLFKLFETGTFSKKDVLNLIKKGADVNAITFAGYSILMMASRFADDPNIIEILISNGANVKYRADKEGKEAFLKNLENNIDEDNFLQIDDEENYTDALHNAARFNHNVGIIKLLLDAGADVNSEDQFNDYTPLMEAVENNNNLEVIKVLLQYGANTKSKDCDGNNLLDIAVCNTNPDVLEILIQNGMPIKNINSALARGVANNTNPKIVETLIKYGADANKVFADGNTILGYAVYNDNSDVLKILCKHINPKNIKKLATKALLQGAKKSECNLDSIKYLISIGADVNYSESRYAGTALTEILRNGSSDGKLIDIVTMFIDAGAEVKSGMIHAVQKDKLSKTEYNKICELLLMHCSAVDEFFWTAIDSSNPNLIKILISKGFSCDTLDRLMYVVEHCKYAEVVEEVLKHCSNINIENRNGRTLLHKAVQFNTNPAVIRKLIEYGANVNANKYIYTPLMNLFRRSEAESNIISDETILEILDVLLDAGADVNQPNKDGDTALMYAVQNHNIYAVDKLLDAGASVETTNKHGQNALYFANDNEELTCLLYAGTSKDDLCSVVSHETDENKIEQLLKKDNSTDVLTKALSIAASNNVNPNIIKLLINNGADVNAVTDNKYTMLMLAVRNHNIGVFKEILSSVKDVNALGIDQKNVLIVALENNADEKIIKLLLDKGVNVNTQELCGTNALLEALENRYSESIIDEILKHGVDINESDKHGNTPLLRAVENNYSELLIDNLVKHGADVNIANKKGKTPLYCVVSKAAMAESFKKAWKSEKSERAKNIGISADKGYEFVKKLLILGANANICGKYGEYSPLLEAVRLDSIRLTKLLLDYGADINIKSKYYKSASDIANNLESGMEKFLETYKKD